MTATLGIFIDSGNSRVKLGWAALGGCAHTEATSDPSAPVGSGAPLRPPISEAHTAAFDKRDTAGIRAWLIALPRNEATRTFGVNVAGPKQAAMLDTLCSAAGLRATWLQANRSAGGLVNAYDIPAQLGPDRWAAMLGARLHANLRQDPAPRPVIMASFGTATTLDTVSPEGVFLGGLILPGPALMRSALFTNTANLPLAESPVALFPTHTHAAITSGIAAAQAGAVLRQWMAASERFGEPPLLFVAGGGWNDIAEEVRRLLACHDPEKSGYPCFLPHPVLDGLALLAQTELTGEA